MFYLLLIFSAANIGFMFFITVKYGSFKLSFNYMVYYSIFKELGENKLILIFIYSFRAIPNYYVVFSQN